MLKNGITQLKNQLVIGHKWVMTVTVGLKARLDLEKE